MRECMDWAMGAGTGRGEDERPEERCSYILMSSPVVLRAAAALVLPLESWVCDSVEMGVGVESVYDCVVRELEGVLMGVKVSWVKLCVREPREGGVGVLDEVYGSVDERMWYDEVRLLDERELRSRSVKLAVLLE